MSFTIRTYQNSAEANRVDKTNFLIENGHFTGNLRNETSIIDLDITIESDTIPDFNYVYIDAFSRYYFVIDIQHVRRKLWNISLKIDVLMSYKDSILNLEGFIDRNEYQSNSDLIDKKRVIKPGYIIDDREVRSSLFSTQSVGNIQPTIIMSGYKLTVEVS